MNIINQLKVPTGDILIVEGERGKLEMLSLGDYGKDVNIKCDALGLTRDIEKVEHTTLLPLEEKWVITISTQRGCNINCKFCDVPKVGPGINATLNDLIDQVSIGLSLHPEVKQSKRLNIHYARMGEPTFNWDVLNSAIHFKTLGDYNVHPVVSTMMPKHNTQLKAFINKWMFIKNTIYNGNAGLQLSINSTNEFERNEMFSNNACSLEEISKIMIGLAPIGRKITLNFAIAGYEIDPNVLLKYFNPANYIIKLTPMHQTKMAAENGIKTAGDYTSYHPYKEIEEKLKAAGYDVLVFIASEYEDLGRITCGNAILSGTKPECPYEIIK